MGDSPETAADSLVSAIREMRGKDALTRTLLLLSLHCALHRTLLQVNRIALSRTLTKSSRGRPQEAIVQGKVDEMAHLMLQDFMKVCRSWLDPHLRPTERKSEPVFGDSF